MVPGGCSAVLLRELFNFERTYRLSSRWYKFLQIGFVPTALRDSIGTAFYFMIFEHLYACLMEDKQLPGGLAGFLSGGVAGTVSWAVIYPFDVIKSHMQASSALSSSKVPTSSRCVASLQRTQNLKAGVLSVTKALWEERGVRGIYRGVVPVLVRAFPIHAVCLGVYQMVKTIPHGGT